MYTILIQRIFQKIMNYFFLEFYSKPMLKLLIFSLLICFLKILLLAYDSDPTSPFAAAKLTVDAGPTTVGSGTHVVSPSSVPGIATQINSQNTASTFSTRKYVEVVDGRTVWGTATRSHCTGPYDNLGLNLRTDTNGVYDYPGW